MRDGGRVPWVCRCLMPVMHWCGVVLCIPSWLMICSYVVDLSACSLACLRSSQQPLLPTFLPQRNGTLTPLIRAPPAATESRAALV